MSFRHSAGYARTWPRPDQQEINRVIIGRSKFGRSQRRNKPGLFSDLHAESCGWVHVLRGCHGTEPSDFKSVHKSGSDKTLSVSLDLFSMSQRRSGLVFAPASNCCNCRLHRRRMPDVYPSFLQGTPRFYKEPGIFPNISWTTYTLS